MSGKYMVEIRHDDQAMLKTLLSGADSPHERVLHPSWWAYQIVAAYPGPMVCNPGSSMNHATFRFELVLGLEIDGWWLEEWLSIEATHPCYVQGLSGADRWQNGHVLEPFEKCDCCDGYNCPQSGSKFNKVVED